MMNHHRKNNIALFFYDNCFQQDPDRFPGSLSPSCLHSQVRSHHLYHNPLLIIIICMAIFVIMHLHICHHASSYLSSYIFIFFIIHLHICYPASSYLRSCIFIFITMHLHICHHASSYLSSFVGRPTATSIAVVVNWTANFLVGLGFLPMRVSFFYCFF